MYQVNNSDLLLCNDKFSIRLKAFCPLVNRLQGITCWPDANRGSFGTEVGKQLEVRPLRKGGQYCAAFQVLPGIAKCCLVLLPSIVLLSLTVQAAAAPQHALAKTIGVQKGLKKS